MKPINYLLVVKIALFSFIIGPLAFAASVSLKKHCDIPGNDLKRLKLATPEACQEACKSNPACKGFGFVSHWNRCFLKSKVKRTFEIKMSAAKIEVDANGSRKIGKIHEYSDSTGKDITVHYGIKSWDKCKVKCLNDRRCESLIFIHGYGSCAPKKKGGQIVSKIFYCGVKS